MTNVASPADAPPERLCFQQFDLDLKRGSLLRAGREIALRPKTFAVLNHLVANPGRLVSKQELFAAVWPNLAVTDDTLVQSIGELRRALGGEGSQLIRTIPRRGYRFDGEVSLPLDQHQAACHGAGTSEPAIGVPQESPLADVENARRAKWAAALALAVLLPLGAVWTAVRSPGPLGPEYTDAVMAPVAAVTAEPTIAVLPFVLHGTDAGHDYFADGLTQDLITAMGRFSALTVVSWNTVAPFKARLASPREIGHLLGVRYQVEGSVLQSNHRVRVAARLVDSAGRVLWSARWDEAIGELSALQDKITWQLAGALAINVAESEQRRVYARPSSMAEAYEYVLRSRRTLQRPTRADLAEARTLLRRAIDIDQAYPAAYAALAESYLIAVAMGWVEVPTSALARAEDMAAKALRLNPMEVRARVALGRVHIYHQRYEEAKVEMDRAVAINPSDADALAGRGNVLTWLGHTDAAIEALERAQRIDAQLNSFDRNALALAYYLKGSYEAAIEQARANMREPLGATFCSVLLAAAYAQQGRTAEAAEVAGLARHMDPTFDPQKFGSKLMNPTHLEHLRDGLRKAGLSGP